MTKSNKGASIRSPMPKKTITITEKGKKGSKTKKKYNVYEKDITF